MEQQLGGFGKLQAAVWDSEDITRFQFETANLVGDGRSCIVLDMCRRGVECVEGLGGVLT
jgi:hypothetical protein